jgi:hypothetical protein
MTNHFQSSNLTLCYYLKHGLASFELDRISPRSIELLVDLTIEKLSFNILNLDIEFDTKSLNITDTNSLVSLIKKYGNEDCLDFSVSFLDDEGFIEYHNSVLILAHKSQELISSFIQNLFQPFEGIEPPSSEELQTNQGKKIIWCSDRKTWCDFVEFKPHTVPDGFNEGQKIEFWTSNEMLFLHWISKYYPINKHVFLEHIKLWDWNTICENPFIKWDSSMIQSSVKDIVWKNFCLTNKLPYSDDSDIEFYQNVHWNSFGEQLLDSFKKDIVESYFQEAPNKHILINHDSEYIVPVIPYKNIQFSKRTYRLTKVEEDNLMRLVYNTDSEFKQQDVALIPERYLNFHYQNLNWEELSKNPNLPWSFGLIFEFEYLWHYENLIHNKAAFQYTLKEDLNDEFLDKVLSDLEIESYQEAEFERMVHESKKEDEFPPF